jgi:uncharacterized protein (DUF1778 family)
MPRQDRVEFRTSHQEREQIEKAAAFLGMNVSAYLRMVAIERSTEVLKNNRTILLSNQNRGIFLEALENPPKPNKNLKKAVKVYQRLRKK